MTPYLNSEGYPDPTAGKALSNISRKERSDRRRQKRKRSAVKKDENTRNRPVSGTR